MLFSDFGFHMLFSDVGFRLSFGFVVFICCFKMLFHGVFSCVWGFSCWVSHFGVQMLVFRCCLLIRMFSLFPKMCPDAGFHLLFSDSDFQHVCSDAGFQILFSYLGFSEFVFRVWFSSCVFRFVFQILFSDKAFIVYCLSSFSGCGFHVLLSACLFRVWFSDFGFRLLVSDFVFRFWFT